MYHRGPPTDVLPVDQPAGSALASASPTTRFTSARARSVRNERVSRDHSLPRNEAPRNHQTVRRVLRDTNTAVIGSTIDFPTLSVHDLNGSALTPGNVLAAVESNDDVYYHLWVAARHVVDEHLSGGLDGGALTEAAMSKFLVEVGVAVAQRVGGPQFVFVDSRRNDDAAAMVRCARRLVEYFRQRGVARNKVLISIPATEDGVLAARELGTVHGIQTNLILVASLMHAAACAEAGATSISIAVGPLLDWHERKRKAVYQDLDMHPGIETIRATLAYFKLHEIRTRLVGTDLRELSELSVLGDFDAVCLSKDQLERAHWSAGIRSAGIPDGSHASLRARQAQHPTTFLEVKTGFLGGMSAETRSMVAGTMYSSLGRMEVQTNRLEKLVEAEVKWQLALRTMTIQALYDVERAPPPIPKTDTRRRKERASSVEPEVQDENRRPESCERENRRDLIEGLEYF